MKKDANNPQQPRSKEETESTKILMKLRIQKSRKKKKNNSTYGAEEHSMAREQLKILL